MKYFSKIVFPFVIIAVFASCNSNEQSKETKDATDKPTAIPTDKPADNASVQRDPKDTATAPKIPDMPNEKPNPDAKFDLKISQNADGSWGYSIWRVGDNHAYINQPHKPGVSGTRGFNTKEQATTVGNFVIDKIKKNAGMPMVTTKELDSLGALK